MYIPTSLPFHNSRICWFKIKIPKIGCLVIVKIQQPKKKSILLSMNHKLAAYVSLPTNFTAWNNLLHYSRELQFCEYQTDISSLYQTTKCGKFIHFSKQYIALCILNPKYIDVLIFIDEKIISVLWNDNLNFRLFPFVPTYCKTKIYMNSRST